MPKSNPIFASGGLRPVRSDIAADRAEAIRDHQIDADNTREKSARLKALRRAKDGLADTPTPDE
jgi:plasmid stabilization system protein ParE